MMNQDGNDQGQPAQKRTRVGTLVYSAARYVLDLCLIGSSTRINPHRQLRLRPLRLGIDDRHSATSCVSSFAAGEFE